MSRNKQKIHVWCVLDRKAGHRSQTMGMLECLRSAYDVSVEEIRFAAWTRPWGRMMQHCWPKGIRFSEIGAERQSSAQKMKPDVVIGSGGGVQWHLAALAKKYDAYSIYLGSPRSIPVADYGQVLHYVPELAAKGVTIIPMMPGPISPDVIVGAWERFQQTMTLPKGPYACCLVGGDGSGYEWTSQDGSRLAQRMNEVHQRYGTRWLITTSRRTPASMENALRAELLGEALADACWAGLGDQRRVVAAYLGGADQVLVSEDSMSMVQEALASAKAVSLFGSAQWQANQRHEQFLQSASEQGWLQRVNLQDDQMSVKFADHHQGYPGDLQSCLIDAVEPKFSAFLSNKRFAR